MPGIIRALTRRKHVDPRRVPEEEGRDATGAGEGEKALAAAPGAADGQALLVGGLCVDDVDEGVHLVAWPFDGGGCCDGQDSRNRRADADWCDPASGGAVSRRRGAASTTRLL